MGRATKYIKRILNFYGKGKHKYVYPAKKTPASYRTGLEISVTPKQQMRPEQWKKVPKRIKRARVVRSVTTEA